MPAVRVLVQGVEILDEFNFQQIEMNVTDQLGEIAVTSTDNRLLAVLK